MLVKNLDFFKQFLDDSTIKAYITLAKSEEQDDYDLNCYIMYMQLKKFFKLAKNDNFNYSFYLNRKRSSIRRSFLTFKKVS